MESLPLHDRGASLSAGGTERERRFRQISAVGLGLFGAYVAALLAGAPEPVTTLAFGVLMIPVPFVAWLTYLRAPGDLRRLWLLLASAASLWFAGTVVWYAVYFAGDGSYPDPPGAPDAIFTAARLTAIAAIVVAMRSNVLFRIAALDATVIGAAGVAGGAAMVAHGLEGTVDWRSLVLLNSPLLGTLTLTLIVSAAMGSTSGLPLSTALVGTGQALLAAGSLVYSYQVVETGTYTDARWGDLLYTGGAIASYLGAAAILLRVDRPIRLFRVEIPSHAPATRPILLLSLGALAVTLAVAAYGIRLGSQPLALIGVVTAVSIGAAMALRGRDSIRTAEVAYSRLDHALTEIERTRDELSASNQELARANARVQALHIAHAELVNLADERSQGRLRQLIEDTGDELAELIEDELDHPPRT